MWPLGGIRTYLKYNYHYFPKDEFDITILANPSIEKDHLIKDMTSEGIKIEWARPIWGKNVLFYHVARMLTKNKYDLIHSQGFFSAFHTGLVNWIFRVPHVLTIHGILEDKYLSGRLAVFKKLILKQSLKNVTVFHGVGSDILEHFKEAFPDFGRKKEGWVVINNGIQAERFLEPVPDADHKLRKQLGFPENKFIFGFFGRFMPQKGFNYIIDAVDSIVHSGREYHDFIILAVGSGDFERQYKNDVTQKGLDRFFHFLPFGSDISPIMKGCGAVLMPSIWEAWGLLACETLTAGIPLIASDCIGLREVIKNTPAIRIPSHDPKALSEAMLQVIEQPELRRIFESAKETAAGRFDVKDSASKLVGLFRKTSRQ